MDLDSMYSRLRSLSGYNSGNDDTKKYLNQAYEHLSNSCDLSNCYLIDDIVADNGKLSKIRENISSISNELSVEINNVNEMIRAQRVAISNEESRVVSESKSTSSKTTDTGSRTSNQVIPKSKLDRLK